MTRLLAILLISVFVFAGCVPPGQIKKQTAPGQIKKHTGYNPASGKVQCPGPDVKVKVN